MMGIPLRLALPLVARNDCADQREDRCCSSCLDRYTRHEVTAARAGRPSGRTFASKRWPRNRLSDFEAISSQTARKPNSVLDDHSSTRRITAAL